MLKALSLCLLMSSLAPMSWAAVHEFTLSRFSTERLFCERQAPLVRDRLAAQTGYTTIGSGCQPHPLVSGHYDLTVQYLAAEPLATQTSDDPSNSHAAYMEGQHRSLNDCMDSLANEADQFREQTGLEVLAQYCRLDSFGSNAHFSAVISGWGTSSVKARLLGVRITGALPERHRSIARAFRKRLEQDGFSVVFADFIAGGLSSYLSAKVYTDHTEHRLANYDVIAFSSEQACERSARDVRQILAKLGPQRPLVSICEPPGPSFRSSLLNIVTWLPAAFRHIQLASSYESSAACEEASIEILAKLEQESAGSVLGSFCHGSRNDFRVNIFTRVPYQYSE